MPFNLFKRAVAIAVLGFSLSVQCHAAEVVAPGARPAQASLLIQSSPLAGSQYHALPDIVDQIHVGDVLALKRDPMNAHDPNAIQVLWQEHLLGFVPRRENKAVARAMDRGTPLIARVVALHPDESPWRRLRFEISMPLDPGPPPAVAETRSSP